MAGNREAHVGQLLHQVGTPVGDLVGRRSGKTAGLGGQADDHEDRDVLAGLDTDHGGCCSRIAAISSGSPIT